MHFDDQDRSSAVTLSEAKGLREEPAMCEAEILRFAQDDIPD